MVATRNRWDWLRNAATKATSKRVGGRLQPKKLGAAPMRNSRGGADWGGWGLSVQGSWVGGEQGKEVAGTGGWDLEGRATSLEEDDSEREV